jgi:DNA polymerase lambda
VAGEGGEKQAEAEAGGENEAVAVVLAGLADARSRAGRPFSARAYERAVRALRSPTAPRLRGPDDVQLFPTLARSPKIRSIVVAHLVAVRTRARHGTGESEGREDAEARLAQDRTKGRLALQEVHGIGPATAARLAAVHGVETLADLTSHPARKTLVAAPTEAALSLSLHTAGRMPRAEATAIAAIVDAALVSSSLSVRSAVCGSYRRGSATCGDVDILLAPTDGTTTPTKLLATLLSLLPPSFILSTLAYAGGTKWMGIVRTSASSLPRRLDLIATPPATFALSLLYFTGSDHFNRSMRSYAGRAGFSLSQTALVPVARGPGGVVIAKGEPVQGLETEEDIFRALLLDFVPPQHR